MDRLMDLTDGDGDATKIDQDETEITGLVPTGDWIGQARIAPLPPAAAPQHPALTLGEGGREEGMGMWLALRLHVVRLVALSPTFGRSRPVVEENRASRHHQHSQYSSLPVLGSDLSVTSGLEVWPISDTNPSIRHQLRLRPWSLLVFGPLSRHLLTDSNSRLPAKTSTRMASRKVRFNRMKPSASGNLRCQPLSGRPDI
jgi:hypothetical protein